MGDNMERRTFFKTSCACGMLSLLNTSPFISQAEELVQQDETKKHVPQGLNQEQVKRIIKFIDASQSEPIKESIFSQLGFECFYSRKLDGWIENYVGNVQAFLDRVNVEKKSKYWEKLEFNKERTVLTLVGKKVDGCACAFSDITEPPKSLCYYCCKNFQQELFGKLLGQKVNVEITESFLLGGERCNTLIHLV
jgi:hypothetical protein